MTEPRHDSAPGSWHAPARLLARFATDPTALDDVTAASIEGHLVACPACRGQLASITVPSDLARSWHAVADRIDRPRQSVVERLLERLGVGGGLARVVSATPALRLAGLAAIVALAVGATLVSRTADAGGPFLVLAPLVPIAAVAATFAPTGNPAGEAGVATPVHGAGLALRRAALVVGTTFVALALAALTVPGVDLEGAAWVLPALALSIGSLALGTWRRIEVCAGLLALGWLVGTCSLWAAEGRRVAVADTSVFEAPGQLAALVTVLAGVAVLVARSDSYATMEARP